MILKPPLFAKPIHGYPLGPDGGLVGCWPMNEGAYNKDFNKVFDLSGNGNHGTFANNTSWATGQFGPAINFTSGDYINIASPSGDPTVGMTCIGWIKSTTTTIQTILCWKNGSGLNDGIWFGVDLYQSGGFVRIYTYLKGVGNNICEDGGPNANDGLWHQFATTYDGSFIRYFQDGSEVGTPDAGTTVIEYTGSTTWIGQGHGPLYPTIGGLDNILLYNRALSASEIALLYREPFCMFERDPIELWSAATLGVAPPVGMAGAMTTNTGYWGW